MMKLLKKFLGGLFLLAALSGSATAAEVSGTSENKVVVAYVTSWTERMPDPSLMTHINYAFGLVNETFDGVEIGNEPRFANIAMLKKDAPHLNVLLSVGGWGAGRFSEMAASDSLRTAFAADCARIVEKYDIDGIDIDWEYPGSSAAGISSSENDRDNFTLLMRDIRKAIGPDKLLTLAGAATPEYIDFRAIMPYVDFVNLVTYDMANAPLHHAALYKSENTPDMTCDSSVKAHIAAGVPAGRLVLGMPFYGRAAQGQQGSNYKNINNRIPEGGSVVFDEVAMVPYVADADGTMVMGFENPASIGMKCDYIDANGLLGAMYWEYNNDNDEKELATAVWNGINRQRTRP